MYIARCLCTEAVVCQQRQATPDATGKEAAPGLAWCSLSEFMQTDPFRVQQSKGAHGRNAVQLRLNGIFLLSVVNGR